MSGFFLPASLSWLGAFIDDFVRGVVREGMLLTVVSDHNVRPRYASDDAGLAIGGNLHAQMGRNAICPADVFEALLDVVCSAHVCLPF